MNSIVGCSAAWSRAQDEAAAVRRRRTSGQSASRFFRVHTAETRRKQALALIHQGDGFETPSCGAGAHLPTRNSEDPVFPDFNPDSDIRCWLAEAAILFAAEQLRDELGLDA